MGLIQENLKLSKENKRLSLTKELNIIRMDGNNRDSNESVFDIRRDDNIKWEVNPLSEQGIAEN